MNNRYLVLFTAASVAAFTLTAQAQDAAIEVQPDVQQQQRDVSHPQQDQAQVAGASVRSGEQSPHAEDIRRVLARVTEEAVKGNVKQVADNFTTSSQDQFNRRGRDANLTGPDARAATDDNRDAQKDEMKSLDDQLKQTSEQLRQAWQEKYGHGFNIDRKNEEMVYGGQTFQILKGDIGHLGQARTAGSQVGATGSGLDNTSSTPAAADTEQRTGTARIGDTTATGTITTTDDDKKDDDGRSLRDRLTGRDRDAAADTANRMATVVAQPSHGAPAVSLTLVNEGTFGNQWHIQPMAGLDYKSLCQGLNHHLQEVLNMKDQWPQDENEAYRLVSHHVLTAIAMPMDASQRAAGQLDTSGAQPAGSQQQPQQPQPSDQSSQQPSQPDQQSQQPDQQNQNR